MKYLQKYYDELMQDIYPQPDQEGHTELTKNVLHNFRSYLKKHMQVLDVGCGEGFAQELFESYGLIYWGIAVGEDAEVAISKGRRVQKMDFNNVFYGDDVFEVIFSRHSLEHSPFPILTLMEWHRVGRNYLILVLPNPEYYSWSCPNHYSIMPKGLAKTLCHRAGWKPISEDTSEVREFRILCEKVERTNEFIRYNEEKIDGKEKQEEEIP